MELVIKKTESGWKWVVETSTQYPVPGTQLKEVTPHDIVLPYILAAADPCESWWMRLRGNPKRAGEISQAAFLLKAEVMGFHVALPWGDRRAVRLRRLGTRRGRDARAGEGDREIASGRI